MRPHASDTIASTIHPKDQILVERIDATLAEYDQLNAQAVPNYLCRYADEVAAWRDESFAIQAARAAGCHS
jgi:hypothetical protein